jgi:tetratricopeptide (TPR) repeat protein
MKIISFFSFKGGVGRTALLMSVAARWAMQGKRVLAVDFDISAPGLSLLPCLKEWLDPVWKDCGVGDALDPFYRTVDLDGPLDFVAPTKLIRRVEPPSGKIWGPGGGLYAIAAGRTDLATVAGRETVDAIPDEVPRRADTRFQRGLRDLAQGWREDLAAWRTPDDGAPLDYVLIDCRTGFPELIDLSLGYLADRMVVLSGLNEQNQRGLRLTLRALTQQDEATVIKPGELRDKLTVVLTPVPNEPSAEVQIAWAQAEELLEDIRRPLENPLPPGERVEPQAPGEGAGSASSPGPQDGEVSPSPCPLPRGERVALEPPPRLFTLPYWPRLAFADPPFYDMGWEPLPPWLTAMETVADALLGLDPPPVAVDPRESDQLYLEGVYWRDHGDLGKAEATFVKAAEAARAADDQRGLAVAISSLGDVMLRRQDWFWLEQATTQAIKRFERRAAAGGADDLAQEDLAIILQRLGSTRRSRGDAEGALEVYQRALSIQENLAAKAPANDIDIQRGLTVAYRNVGQMHEMIKDWLPAQTAHRRSLDINRRLAAQTPEDLTLQRDVSISENGVGGVLKAQGAAAQALECFQRSLIIDRRLAALSPVHVQAQEDLGLTLGRCIHALADLGRLPEAVELLRETRNVFAALVNTDPSNAFWQENYAVALTNSSLPGTCDVNERLQHLQQAVIIVERLAKGDRLPAHRAGWLDNLRAGLAALQAKAEAAGDRKEPSPPWGEGGGAASG